MDINCWSPKFWLQNEEDCVRELQKQWEQIPLLNANDIQYLTNQKLVRFRGMIQDMHNPEYYYGKYEVINEITKEASVKNGKYLDIADCKDNEVINMAGDKNKTSERNTLIVISIPALNNWVVNYETEQYKKNIETNKESLNASFKRKNTENDDSEMQNENMQTDCENTQNLNNKKQCTQLQNGASSSSHNQQVISAEYLLNFPIENNIGKACHIKIYDDNSKFKLNEMYEFVGFLSVDPQLAMTNMDKDEFESEMEVQTHHPSPSLIPRIHCVDFKKLAHNNPLLNNLEMNREKIEDMRKELMIVLTQILLGDEIAAEFLLYHLISRVHFRQNMMALGKFSLNLSKIPLERTPGYCEKFYEFIELLLCKSHYFPMTLSNMNSVTFTPKKDYECDRLTSGLFQLSDKTHLILDETKLSPGKLNEAGVKAVQAMSNIITQQKVNYDFNYYQMEYDCDIPFLVLSEGKSLLPCDCHVPIKPAEICLESYEDLFNSTKAYLIQDRLNEMRKYLTQTCFGEYEIEDNIEKIIQDDFVTLRQNENITGEDLHQLLVLARLICLSEGKKTLTEDSWKKAVNLEKERKCRLPTPSK